jgi:hypothetical protein
VRLALENELRRLDEAVPLRERLRLMQERVIGRPTTGLQADRAFVDAPAIVAILTSAPKADTLGGADPDGAFRIRVENVSRPVITPTRGFRFILTPTRDFVRFRSLHCVARFRNPRLQ